MSTYAIGDIQGCYNELMKLVDTIRFDSRKDRLWIVGDMVNRGPDSLAVLRWVKAQGDAAVCVLGNHDLHLLALARGRWRPRPGDSLDETLDAPDLDELVEWLLHRPFMHREGQHVLVHAGLLPDWSVADAEGWARAAETRLRRDPDRFLTRLSDVPKVPFRRAGVTDVLATSVFTRIRACGPDHWPDFRFKGELADLKQGAPWFRIPHPRTDTTVIFGHWAALGLHLGQDSVGLDTGCVWGNRLTAMRLEDRRLYQVAAGATPETGDWSPESGGLSERPTAAILQSAGGAP